VVAVLLAAVAALLAPAASLARTASAVEPRVAVLTPAPGDVTIEGIASTFARGAGREPPFALIAPNERALPANVLALTATHEVRTKHAVTYHTVVIVLNVGAGAARARAAFTLLPEDIKPSELLGTGKFSSEGIDTARALALFFTGPTPASDDKLVQDSASFHLPHDAAKSATVTAQPNANTTAVSPRDCTALTWAVGPYGSASRWLATGPIDNGHAVGGWSDKPDAAQRTDVLAALEDAYRKCAPGNGGLATALPKIEQDLGLVPPPGSTTKPIGPEQAFEILFGAALNGESNTFAEALEDYVLWQEEEEFFEELFGPPSLLRAPPPRARAASTHSAAVPVNGQVTQVRVRGYYVPGHCPVADSVCEQNVHFQDLRPQPDGKLEVISTTQAFTLPHEPGTYSFAPTNFYVQKGDYIGLAAVGGRFEVLVNAAGTQTDMFKGHEKDNNGDQVSSSSSFSGQELNMQVTLKPSG